MTEVTLQDLKAQDDNNAFDGIVFIDDEGWFERYLDAWCEVERVYADCFGLQEAKVDSDTWEEFWHYKCQG